MSRRPYLYALPSLEPALPTLDEVISEIAMDALISAKTAIPPRNVSGLEIERAVRDNLETLISAYMRTHPSGEVISAL